MKMWLPNALTFSLTSIATALSHADFKSEEILFLQQITFGVTTALASILNSFMCYKKYQKKPQNTALRIYDLALGIYILQAFGWMEEID